MTDNCVQSRDCNDALEPIEIDILPPPPPTDGFDDVVENPIEPKPANESGLITWIKENPILAALLGIGIYMILNNKNNG